MNDEKKLFRIKDTSNRWEIIGRKTVTGEAPGIGCFDYDEVEITNGFCTICVPETYLEDYEIKNRCAEAWEEGRNSLKRQIKTMFDMEFNPYGGNEEE